jgi:hypothetical protein
MSESPYPDKDRSPAAAAVCGCDRPAVFPHADGEAVRCFWCARPLPGQRPTMTTANGKEVPVENFDKLIRGGRHSAPRTPEPERERPDESVPDAGAFDAEIRRRSGHTPAGAVPVPAEDEPGDEEATDDEQQQLWAWRAAVKAGVPADRLDWAAPRLRARTQRALAAEAVELRDLAAQAGLFAPKSEESRTGGFDGGTRQSLPQPPSFDQQLHRTWQERQGGAPEVTGDPLARTGHELPPPKALREENA